MHCVNCEHNEKRKKNRVAICKYVMKYCIHHYIRRMRTKAYAIKHYTVYTVLLYTNCSIILQHRRLQIKSMPPNNNIHYDLYHTMNYLKLFFMTC